MAKHDYDLIVIGAGTAGMTAALYALRNGKSVLLLERESVGGQIALSPKVENFPSIKEISGAEFSDNLFEQIVAIGADIEIEEVLGIEKLEDDGFAVTTDYKKYTGGAVVIAAGLKHRDLGLTGEEKFLGKGIYYCALCDGPFYADREVAVIGGGNTALQYAILLSDICKKVTVVTVGDHFSGEPANVKRLEQRSNIEVKHGKLSVSILGDDAFEGLALRDTHGTATEELRVDAIFVAIGQVTDNARYQNLVELDSHGFIVADESTCTTCDGIYVAGDCRVKAVRQLTTAVGDGANAAIAALKYIERHA